MDASWRPRFWKPRQEDATGTHLCTTFTVGKVNYSCSFYCFHVVLLRIFSYKFHESDWRRTQHAWATKKITWACMPLRLYAVLTLEASQKSSEAFQIYISYSSETFKKLKRRRITCAAWVRIFFAAGSCYKKRSWRFMLAPLQILRQIVVLIIFFINISKIP